MIQKMKSKIASGSVLIFTLIMMFILLTLAVGMMSVTSIERKSGGAGGKSVVAFQIADTGAETVMNILRKKSPSDLVQTWFPACTNSIITGNAGGGNYTVTFMKQDGTNVSCNESISNVYQIKSVGMYSGASRAVQVAVAADYWTITTADPTEIVNTNTGNVGIGTTDPSAKLHVVGPAVIPGLIGQIQTVSPNTDTQTVSGSFGDMNGMTITLNTRANSKLYITWNTSIYNQGGSVSWGITRAVLDGTAIGASHGAYLLGGTVGSIGGNAVGTVTTAGSHQVKIQWRTVSSLISDNPGTYPDYYGRTLTVMEVYQ